MARDESRAWLTNAHGQALSRPAAAADHSEAQTEAERIVAEAEAEAEAIKLEAEEQADQRAAKLIARAREEADQVRQTVATLTAQADDARLRGRERAAGTTALCRQEDGGSALHFTGLRPPSTCG